jgi:hypothetical protein
VNEAFQVLYESCLETVRALCEIDPAPDSAEGRLLLGLATACEEYEKSKFPLNDPPLRNILDRLKSP